MEFSLQISIAVSHFANVTLEQERNVISAAMATVIHPQNTHTYALDVLGWVILGRLMILNIYNTIFMYLL